jgi:nucleoside-diphosphate-sugar epimerase
MSLRLEPLLDIAADPPAAPRHTYLVTGCAGFIGSHLSEALLERGDRVVGIDSFTDHYSRQLKEDNLRELRRRPGFTLLEADLVDAPLPSLVGVADGVFHLAGRPGARGSWGRTFGVDLRENLLATQRVFEAAADAGVRVVFASSSSVYGNAPSYPICESSPMRPVSPLGVTELCREQLAHMYATCAGLDFVGLRYFTVYGPRQRPDMAVNRIATALSTGDTFHVYGTGDQSRDVTYVDDAVLASIAVIDAAPAGATYNVGGGSETSLRRVMDLCRQLSGCELDMRFHPPATGDVRRTAADTTRIRADVGWAPQTTLEEGLASQLAWAAARSASLGRSSGVAQSTGVRSASVKETSSPNVVSIRWRSAL